MRANWRAPACDRNPDFPADLTLTAYAQQQRERGLTWREIGAMIGVHEETARVTVQRPGRKRKLKGPRLTAKEWRFVADAYGVTVKQLRAIRAQGLTVKQFREMAERSA